MGIQGLLKGLNSVLVSNDKDAGGKNKNISSNNIRQFRNQSLAIDASSWLFKAAYSCAERLVESIERCEHTPDPYVERVLCNYMLKRCEELFANASIRQIYLVFEGKRSPIKSFLPLPRTSKKSQPTLLHHPNRQRLWTRIRSYLLHLLFPLSHPRLTLPFPEFLPLMPPFHLSNQTRKPYYHHPPQHVMHIKPMIYHSKDCPFSLLAPLI